MLFALVKERYGSRLRPEQEEGVTQVLTTLVETVRALRAVRLPGSDEPAQPFKPFREEP
jgi:hypothetical protein